MHALTHYHLKIVDSTNEWAKRNINRLNPENLTVIVADEQSAGRGRHNHQWFSPPLQNIYTTFCFYITEQRADIANLPQVMAISAVETLANYGFNVKIKWPNDLLMSSKKVGGILCETTGTSQGLLIILGIGINVNMTEEEMQKIDQPATSLFIEGKALLPLKDLQENLERVFARNLSIFLKKGFSSFLPFFRQAFAIEPNQNMRFQDQNRRWEGKFHSINDDGSLNMELPSKEIKRFLSGEAFF